MIHSSSTLMKSDRRQMVLGGQRGLDKRSGVGQALVDPNIEGLVILQPFDITNRPTDLIGFRMKIHLMSYLMVFRLEKSQYFTLEYQKIIC